MAKDFTKKSFKINVTKEIGDVGCIYYLPEKAEQILVFAHGAGAGMTNKSMEQFALALAEKKIATLRFNFPYMENGKKVPDRKPVCTATIVAAIEKAKKLNPEIPLFAGGKSFGGRMTSTAASEDLLKDVNGIVFFGFPLHAPGKAGNERAEHLYSVKIPMLFLQGTRDALASLEYLKPVVKKLGNKAKLFIIEGADHSFNVPKDNKLKGGEVVHVIAQEVKNWMNKIR